MLTITIVTNLPDGQRTGFVRQWFIAETDDPQYPYLVGEAGADIGKVESVERGFVLVAGQIREARGN